jgi:hypothetical protein
MKRHSVPRHDCMESIRRNWSDWSRFLGLFGQNFRFVLGGLSRCFNCSIPRARFGLCEWFSKRLCMTAALQHVFNVSNSLTRIGSV